MVQIKAVNMILSITIEITDEPYLAAEDAVAATQEYIGLTGDKFGGIEWEFESFHRRSAKEMVVHFKRKERTVTT